MCGIVGYIGPRVAEPILVDGLSRLEYRGYDSAGVATLDGGLGHRRRAAGKLMHLKSRLQEDPCPGSIGIGHTRWATHGAPTLGNAHPHGTARVAVVHNGIIENHAELRAELEDEGQVFETETDTETVAQLIDLHLRRGMGPEEAAGTALGRLHGAYALAIIFAGHHGLMVGARRGAPLAIGHGDTGIYLGSDALALAPMAPRLSYLEDGDWAVLTRGGAVVRDGRGALVERVIKRTSVSGAVSFNCANRSPKRCKLCA